MIKKVIIFCTALFVLPVLLIAGDFTNSGISDIPGLYAGSAVWGDIDNDGDLDLIVAGDMLTASGNVRITYIYHNSGGTLTKVQELNGVYFGAIALGDYNNDGFLDLAVAGIDNDDKNILMIYKNSSGQFVEDTDQTDLVPVRYAALAWGDYNNDGHLDLVVTGMDDIGNARSIVYKNHTSTFSSILKVDEQQTILNINKGAVAWADLDSDGDLDLVMSGIDIDGTRTARIIKNDPVGYLRVNKDIEDSQLENLYAGNSSLALGDVDSDGDYDILKSGWSSGWRGTLYLMQNNGSRGFGDDMLQGGTLQKIVGPVNFADIDNDGDLDFSAFGRDRFGSLYGYFGLNSSTGTFSKDQTQSGLPQLRDGAAAWGDYDGDGDLDLFVSGINAEGERVSQVFRNGESASASQPLPPTILNAPFITNSGVLFSWEHGSDTNSPEKGLTYNIRIGQTSSSDEIYSSAVPAGPGILGNNTSFRLLRELSPGRYYFSVQTVDRQFMKSAFSTPREFWIETFVSSNQVISDFLQGAVAFADINNDDYQDMIISGKDGNGNERSVLYNNVNGELEENLNQTFIKFKYGDFAWGDYDNDGDLDLAFSGNYVRSDKVIGLYENSLSGTLKLNTVVDSVFVPVDYSSMDWGDFDNDGDLDLVVIGRDDSNFSTRIYRNNGDKTFSIVSGLSIMGYGNGKVQWIDYDNDGDLDLFLAGQTANEDNNARLYTNDGTGSFTERTGIDFGSFLSASFGWADFDSDGDFDLIITGRVTASANTAQIKYFMNLGSGLLSENSNILSSFSAVQGGDIALGDYDNDGDTDIIITGNYSSSAILQAYQNEGFSFNVDAYRVFQSEGIDFSSTAFVDIENDGDLDFVMSGRDKTSLQPRTKVFDNITAVNIPNAAPQPPSTLSASVSGSSAVLTWGRGSDPDQYGTAANSLTYILRIGTTPGGNDIYSGMTTRGFGREGMALTRTIHNLQSGTFYWNVRSVDNEYKMSDWSVTSSFIIDVIKPAVASAQITPPLIGIGKGTVLIEINENFNLDHSKLPEVNFSINSGTDMPVSRVSYDGKTWIGEVTILSSYPSGTASLSISGVTDESGNVMDAASGIVTFQVDTDLPIISSTTPASNQAGISVRTNPSAVFNEDMSSIDMENGFKLFLGTESIGGTITYDPATRKMTFIPGTSLNSSSEFQATVVSTAKDLAGNSLSGDYSWFFRTADVVSSENGGNIQTEDGSLNLYLPPNALIADEEIPIESFSYSQKAQDVQAPDDINFVGPAFRLGPDNKDVSLSKKGILTLKYVNGNYTGKNEDKFAIFKINESTLALSKVGGTLAKAAKEVSTPVKDLGIYGVFEDLRTGTGESGISDIAFSPRVFSPNKTSSSLPATTTLTFKLGTASTVTIDIFNSTGRAVRRLIDGREFGNAAQSVIWDGKDGNGRICTSGLYLVKIKGNGFEEIKTVAILNK